MGFEDNTDYDNVFETNTADPNSEDFAEKPKKLSRKELREARKKNAEKTADLPKKKKGFFARHERLDDDDSLSGQHLFDPTQETKVSAPREHKSDYDSYSAPIRNSNSEFSYLFDPADDDESEDDVYPDESIYSDGNAARDLLGGLSYDEARDGDSHEFDKYFDNAAEVRPPSRFSFKKHKAQDDEPLPDIEDDDLPQANDPVKVVPQPVIKREDQEVDSYLPELRPDSVFAPKKEAAPEEKVHFTAQKEDESEEDYMSQDSNDLNQDFMPYGMPGMYPSYPMQPIQPMPPMNQMMSYPVVIPSSVQNQGGVSYQTIPIPYPVPMPYPMYSQGYYPQYPQYPQYQQYPQYPPQYPPYGGPDYYGRYAPSNYDDRRGANYDDRYDSRHDHRRDDRYDSRREHHRDNRYEEHREYDYNDRHEDYERNSYPKPPYPSPYDENYGRTGDTAAAEQRHTESAESHNEPIYTPQPDPINTESASAVNAAAEPDPILPANNFSGFDFTFNKPVQETESPLTNSFANDDFDVNGFDNNLSDGLDSGDLGGFDSDFGSPDKLGTTDNSLGFSSVGGNSDMAAAKPAEEGKPRGGRFKKHR